MKQQVIDQYQYNGIMKTIDGMNILAEEVNDDELKNNIEKYVKIVNRYYDSNRGDKIFIVDKFDLDGLKNYLLTMIPKYSEMKNDKIFTKRLYASVQLLKINKIIQV